VASDEELIFIEQMKAVEQEEPRPKETLDDWPVPL